jgi:hypothetical protein
MCVTWQMARQAPVHHAVDDVASMFPARPSLLVFQIMLVTIFRPDNSSEHKRSRRLWNLAHRQGLVSSDRFQAVQTYQSHSITD